MQFRIRVLQWGPPHYTDFEKKRHFVEVQMSREIVTANNRVAMIDS
jgi:hypothetical protein